MKTSVFLTIFLTFSIGSCWFLQHEYSQSRYQERSPREPYLEGKLAVSIAVTKNEFLRNEIFEVTETLENLTDRRLVFPNVFFPIRATRDSGKEVVRDFTPSCFQQFSIELAPKGKRNHNQSAPYASLTEEGNYTMWSEWEDVRSNVIEFRIVKGTPAEQHVWEKMQVIERTASGKQRINLLQSLLDSFPNTPYTIHLDQWLKLETAREKHESN